MGKLSCIPLLSVRMLNYAPRLRGSSLKLGAKMSEWDQSQITLSKKANQQTTEKLPQIP